MYLSLYALFGVPMLQISYFSQQMCSWKVYMETHVWNKTSLGMRGESRQVKDSR